MELRPIHYWLAKSLNVNVTEPPLDETDQFLVESHNRWKSQMDLLNSAVEEYESVLTNFLYHKIETDADFRNHLKSLLK